MRPREKAEWTALPPARPPPALLLPPILCSRCRARPRLRVTPALRTVCEELDPGALLATIRCRCGEVVVLSAHDVVGASHERR